MITIYIDGMNFRQWWRKSLWLLLFYAQGWLLLGASMFLAVDAWRLVSDINSDESSPYYSNVVWERPLTNVVLFFCEKAEEWKDNTTDEQSWYVREVQFMGKEFWTVLKKVKKREDKKVVV